MNPLQSKLAFTIIPIVIIVEGTASAQFNASNVTKTAVGGPFQNRNPVHFSIGDLNHDGFADVVTADIGSDTLTSLMNFGGLGFISNATALSVRSLTTWVCIGNLDILNDKILDVVSTPSGYSAIDYAKGFGNGNFAPHNGFAIPGLSPLAANIIDVDLDGIPDMVYTRSLGPNTPGDAVFVKGNGDYSSTSSCATPNFCPNVTVGGSVLNIPNSLANGDITGTGVWGGAITCFDSASIQIRETSNSVISTYSTPVHPRCVALGDLDGDHILDFASASLSAPVPGVVYYLSTESYGTQHVVPYTYTAGEQTVSVVIGDVTCDGIADIVVALCQRPVSPASDPGVDSGIINKGGGIVDVYDMATGSPVLASSTAIPNALGVRWISLNDVNTDGKNDAIIVNRYSNDIRVLDNQTPRPDGLTLKECGTPGCFGKLGMNANSKPSIGNNNFRLTCTNGPRNIFGFVIISIAGPPNAFTSAVASFFEVSLCCNFDVAYALNPSFAMWTNSVGDGVTGALSIPNDPAYVGLTFCAQAAFLEDRADGYSCSNSSFNYVTSKVLEITIQP